MKRLLLVIAVLVASEGVAAADEDPWLGHDKVLHFGVSGTIADLSYVGATQIFDSRSSALLAAAGFTLAIGAAKETLDLAGLGDPSWKDFTWDVIGAAAGLALAWSMDLFVRGVGSPFGNTHDHLPLSQPRALQSFIVRF